jgi:hypothetical protein
VVRKPPWLMLPKGVVAWRDGARPQKRSGRKRAQAQAARSLTAGPAARELATKSDRFTMK